MLLEIDHIAIPSVHFDNDISLLQSLGYQIKFVESHVKNLSIKHKLQKTFSKYHDLALLTSKDSISIELISVGRINIVSPYIVPVFENLPPKLISGNTKNFKNLGIGVEMNFFEIPICVKQNKKNTKFSFNKLIIKTKDVKKSSLFWQFFGFKTIQSDDNSMLLEFKSLLSKKIYYLYLQEYEKIHRNHNLDDKGFNCIAFISNSAKNEKNLFDKEGIYYTTKIESMIINQKLLNVFFVKGPSGELVEVISVESQ